MVRYKKLAGITLNLTSDAKSWLNSFMALGQISEIGKKKIIEVATTAEMLDNSIVIEYYHIIEATESRLFDRASWVIAINDASIPEYNGSDYLKFDS